MIKRIVWTGAVCAGLLACVEAPEPDVVDTRPSAGIEGPFDANFRPEIEPVLRDLPDGPFEVEAPDPEVLEFVFSGPPEWPRVTSTQLNRAGVVWMDTRFGHPSAMLRYEDRYELSNEELASREGRVSAVTIGFLENDDVVDTAVPVWEERGDEGPVIARNAAGYYDRLGYPRILSPQGVEARNPHAHENAVVWEEGSLGQRYVGFARLRGVRHEEIFALAEGEGDVRSPRVVVRRQRPFDAHVFWSTGTGGLEVAWMGEEGVESRFTLETGDMIGAPMLEAVGEQVAVVWSTPQGHQIAWIEDEALAAPPAPLTGLDSGAKLHALTATGDHLLLAFDSEGGIGIGQVLAGEGTLGDSFLAVEAAWQPTGVSMRWSEDSLRPGLAVSWIGHGEGDWRERVWMRRFPFEHRVDLQTFFVSRDDFSLFPDFLGHRGRTAYWTEPHPTRGHVIIQAEVASERPTPRRYLPTHTRITAGPILCETPAGALAIYPTAQGLRGRLFTAEGESLGPEVRLAPPEAKPFAAAWDGDEVELMFTTPTEGNDIDLWRLTLDAEGQPTTEARSLVRLGDNQPNIFSPTVALTATEALTTLVWHAQRADPPSLISLSLTPEGDLLSAPTPLSEGSAPRVTPRVLPLPTGHKIIWFQDSVLKTRTLGLDGTPLGAPAELLQDISISSSIYTTNISLASTPNGTALLWSIGFQGGLDASLYTALLDPTTGDVLQQTEHDGRFTAPLSIVEIGDEGWTYLTRGSHRERFTFGLYTSHLN